MSIRGNTFTGGSAGPHLEVSVGNIASLYDGAFTIASLVRTTNNNLGFFGGWSDSVGGSNIGGYLIAAVNGASLFGMNDFSSGFGGDGTLVDGGTITDGTYRWFVYSKAAGSNTMRMHIADLSTLTWTHGVSSGAGNHPDRGTAAVFSIGFQNYPMGNLGSADYAVTAAWKSSLSDGSIESACTGLATDLVSASPNAGWFFKQADFGSAFTDFTGGGADQTTRIDIVSSTDPADYDFTLGSGAGHRLLAFF